MRALITLTGSWILLAAAYGISIGQPPEPVPQQGVEVQTRGPIHEAFAEPSDQKAGPGPVVPKQPPEPVKELPPEERPEGDQVQWIPGYWAWDDDSNDFLWVSGIWRAPPPNQQWAPGYWQQVQGGWQWVSGYWAPLGGTTVELLPAPPEPVEEAIPPAPGADMIYVPGVWVFAANQYLWQPGYWAKNQPGWIWTPACYHWTPGGYVFVKGFWDHDLDHRGFCFAPVRINLQLAQQPGWYFRPVQALATDALLSSLFVHRGWHHYYFGDYYDAGYARRGYIPWTEHRYAKTAPDPLFSYYRWENRTNPRWDGELRDIYKGRRDGTLPRPARTLTLHEKQVSGKEKMPRVTVPLNKWQGKTFKLEPVPKKQAEELHKSVEQWRNISQQRHKLETQIKAAPPVQTKTPVVHQPTRIELPRTTISHPITIRTPPTHPTLPKPQPAPKQPKGK